MKLVFIITLDLHTDIKLDLLERCIDINRTCTFIKRISHSLHDGAFIIGIVSRIIYGFFSCRG